MDIKKEGVSFDANYAASQKEPDWVNEMKGKELWPFISETEEEARLKEVHRQSVLQAAITPEKLNVGNYDSTSGAGTTGSGQPEAANKVSNGGGPAVAVKPEPGATAKGTK